MNDSFFDQFIEDYFSEAEEHLAIARRVLLGLDVASARALPEPPLLRELFRSLHTLKGLSGMVGDAEAERVAHALEDALRATERAGTPPGPVLVDLLFEGVELLGRCIAARRANTSPPDTAFVVRELQRVGTGIADAAPPHAPGSMASQTALGAMVTSPERVHRVRFFPSTELTARGVGVDAIRARLAGWGTLLEAKPSIVDGAVAFDFRVSAPADRVPDEGWASDGMQWSSEHVAATPGTTAGDSDGDGAVRPAAPPPAPEAPQSAASTSASIVRVDLARLDGVMRLVGDLVVSRSRLGELIRQASATGAPAVTTTMVDALEETNAAMERQLRQLRDSVMRIRLVPIGEVFERLRFTARDAIRASGKQVTLSFRGQGTEIDKLVVDRMLEPLLHLVRNAVAHGIESPEERLAAGKPAEGTLGLRASASGDRICVEVEDDGAGIDLERVARKARAGGMLAEGDELTTERLLDVICTPGFSTRESADLTSGRGVGMDVVRSTIRALAGELTLITSPGRGTRFVIELPLTLMILDALLVEIGGRQMAVPQPALREVLQVEARSITSFENNDIIRYRHTTLPLISLARLFGLADTGHSTVYVLVVGGEAAPMGLVVDRLVGLREIVVLPVADPLVAVPGIGGATELGDGRVTLIIDAAALLRLAHDRRERRTRGGPSLNVRATTAQASPSQHLFPS